MQDRSGAEWAWRRAGLVQQGEASVAGEEAGVHARVSELWEAASASVSAASTSSSSQLQLKLPSNSPLSSDRGNCTLACSVAKKWEL